MKPLTLVLCVIAILGSVASTLFYFQIDSSKEQLRHEVGQTETRTTELKAKLAEANIQNEVLQKRLVELDSDLGETKLKAAAAESRSTQVGRDNVQLRTQINANKEALPLLNAEIAQLKQELAQLKLTAAMISPEDVEAYKTTIATLKAQITELASSAAKASIRSTNTIRSQPVTAASKTVEIESDGYEVVSIGTDNAFVVIKAGSAQGLQNQQTLFISRNRQILGSAVVSSVQENYSIAQIVTGSVRGNLNKGDIATLSH